MKSRHHRKSGPGRMPHTRAENPRPLRPHQQLLEETNMLRAAFGKPPLGPRHGRRSER